MTHLTRYELIAIDPSGKSWLAGYVHVPSLDGAMRMLRQNGQEWLALTGNSECQVTGKGRTGWTLHLGGWVIRYSGRTKLEAGTNPLEFFTHALK